MIKYVLKFKYKHEQKYLYYPITTIESKDHALAEALEWIEYCKKRDYIIEEAELQKHETTIITTWRVKRKG